MNKLIPYPESAAPAIDLTTDFTKKNDSLYMSYLLTGDLDGISIPEISTTPQRKDLLWESTCFEFFIQPAGKAEYWEFNLSPSGDWNVYHMDSYRKGMRREEAISTLPFTIKRLSCRFNLELEFDLKQICAENCQLMAGITAVIKDSSGNCSYWALKHAGTKPDFHLAESFILKL